MMKSNLRHIVLLIWLVLLAANPILAWPWAESWDSNERPEYPKNDTDPKEKDSTKTKKTDKAQLEYLRQMAALRRKGMVLPDNRTASHTSPAQLISTASSGAKVQTTAPSLEKEIPTFRKFPSLDEKMAGTAHSSLAKIQNRNAEESDFNLPFAKRKPEFNKDFLSTHFPLNPRADTLVAQAKKAFAAVQELGNFVDIITGQELLELPVGLSKKDSTSGNSVQLAITQVQFTPQYAELKAWAKMTIPQKGENGEPDRDIFFGAEGIKLSHDGALLGDMRLVLLGNQAIPINGDNWLLTLKGGVDLKTGGFGEQSFVEFDCSGLKSIGLQGDLRVSRNVLLPLDEQGEYVCGASPDNQFNADNVIDNNCYVGTSFDLQANGWNDLLLTVNLPRFEVVGLKGWGFNLENVVLDLSDSQSSPNLQLPEAYDGRYSGNDIKLWRGFFAEEVSVMLPKGIENTKSSTGRVEFGARNLVLDSQGVSGTFFGENVLQTGDGAAGKWAFTIDDVSISLAANSLTGGSIGGDIAVPIFEEPMDYNGYIAVNGYGLEAVLNSSYKAPVFLGEIQLERNSIVAINVQDGNVYPYANLTGQLTVAGKINQEPGESPDPEAKNGFQFNGIRFQELELQTEPGQPVVQARSFGYEGEMKLMNFPASVSNLALVTPNNQVGLSFDLTINLDDGGSHATTSLDIIGNLEEDAKIQEWKFDRVAVDGIRIDYEKSGFEIVGELKVMEDDPTYGDGFSGELEATFNELNFTATGRAMFGRTDFRYWFVDIWTESINGGGDTKLPIKSFVGGVSNRMHKVSGNSTGFEPGSAVYAPDADTGLGVRAGVKITTENADAFSGKAYLEMEFNTHGGLNRIGFMGEGAFMGGESQGGGGDSATEVAGVFGKVNDFIENNKEKADELSKYGNFLGLSQEAIPVRDVAASGAIGVYVGIEKDFVNQTFDGEFELYMDLEGIKGGGENNLAGYAKMHTGPDDWYIYIGTPQRRIELLFQVGAQVRVGGYFMTGTQLPSPSDISPHPIVQKIFGDDIESGERKGNQLEAGKGFAFGLNFGYGYTFDWGLFYAFVEAGAGFDVMHAYYPNASCVGRSGPVGNDGWYSMGQVYAYLYGEFGVKVDLAFIKGNFVIAEAGVAASLKGQFPNPVYIQGNVGMYYSILGGLVSGRMRLKVEIGEECILENINNAVGVPMISDLTPRDKSNDVSVFAAPQAVFNYAANSDFTVDLEEGQRTFRLQLKEFTVTSAEGPIEGELTWNDTNDAVTFEPAETLPSEKEVTVVVEVSFDEKIGGAYQTMVEDGKPVVERLESVFMTDKAPDYIVWEKLEYIYPVREQQSFYPDEYKTGYFKMSVPQNYLFNQGYEMRAEFVSRTTGQGVRTDINYDQSKGTVFFDIPEMQLDSEYDMNLIVFPPGANIETEIIVERTELLQDEEVGETDWYDPVSGTQSKENVSGSAVVSNKKAANVTVSNAAPKSILDYSFKTSKHASFGDKVGDLTVTGNLTNFIYADVHSLSLRVADYEYLDALEVLGGRYTASQPLVYAQAVVDDFYYRQKIGPLLYDKEVYPLDGNIRVNREENVLGVPPVRSFYVGNEYLANLENNPNSPWVKNRIPFVYNLPYQYKTDMTYLKNTILNRYDSSGGDAEKYDSFRYLTETSFPPLPLGTYPSQLIYRTPGNIHQKGYEIQYEND